MSQGSTYSEEPWGQLAPKFSDLSEKPEQLVASEKQTPEVATLSSLLCNSKMMLVLLTCCYLVCYYIPEIE